MFLCYFSKIEFKAYLLIYFQTKFSFIDLCYDNFNFKSYIMNFIILSDKLYCSIGLSLKSETR